MSIQILQKLTYFPPTVPTCDVNLSVASDPHRFSPSFSASAVLTDSTGSSYRIFHWKVNYFELTMYLPTTILLNNLIAGEKSCLTTLKSGCLAGQLVERHQHEAVRVCPRLQLRGQRHRDTPPERTWCIIEE